MLFSPRLYIFKGKEGVTFEFESGNQASLHSLYADLMFCAALNHWTLTHSADEEFPYKRIDFHAFAVSNPKDFNKCLIFAMQAISGKSLKELSDEALKAQKPQENGQKAEGETEVKKKNPLRWIMNLLRLS